MEAIRFRNFGMSILGSARCDTIAVNVFTPSQGSHVLRPRMVLCDRFRVLGKLGTGAGAFETGVLQHD